MFRPEDLQSIDAYDYVRKEQGRFFRRGRFDPLEAASLIALEAMLADATDVRISVVGGWLCIYSDVDWLDGLGLDVFSGLVPFVPGGPNAVTSEFLIVVFSRSVATASRIEKRIIKGDSLGPLSVPNDGWDRAIAFEAMTSEIE